MKKIAVSGGKGGVGKSTVSVLLAQEKTPVLLVDLDVECPNDHLLLNQPIENSKENIKAPYPVVNKDKCKKCGKCVDVCHENAIFQAPGEYPGVFHNLCSNCGACWLSCPHGAIEKEYQEIGWIYENKISPDFHLITGEARAGLEETGPVVLQVKEYALKKAKELGVETVIFDTAAGMHCPVISAFLDIDQAFLVTEPNPLGVHDLNLMLELTKKLKLKSEIIINQSDLSKDLSVMEKLSRKHDSRIAYKIPHSREIVQAYSRGDLSGLKLTEFAA